MARYINLDAICEILDEDIKTGDERVTISWVKSWLLTQSKIIIPDSADVVPRSELEQMRERLLRATRCAIEAMTIETTHALEEKEKKVAREIFERLHAHRKTDGRRTSIWLDDLICIAKEYGVDLKKYEEMKGD